MRSAAIPLLLSVLILLPTSPLFAQEEPARVLHGASWDAPEAPDARALEEREPVRPPETDEGIILPIDSSSEFARIGALSVWYGRPDAPAISRRWMNSSYGQGPKRVRNHRMGERKARDAIRTSWMGRSSREAVIKRHWMGGNNQPARITYDRMGD